MTVQDSDTFHALRFGRSAVRYEAQAGVQARMADALLSLWGDRIAPTRILEFGCGTGLLTRRLRARFPAAAHLATDASPEMLDLARAAAHDPTRAPVTSVPHPLPAFAILDARGTAAAHAALHDYAATHPALFPVDLVASGALVQWFPDLTAHLRFAASFAAPDAAYLISGFHRENFPELNTLLAEPPFSYHDFPGHAPEAVEAAAGAAGWSVSGMLSWDEHEEMPDARAVLRRMQDLGAVRDPRAGGRMTRAHLAHLLSEYERRFSGEDGVRLTWKPWAALLVKA